MLQLLIGSTRPAKVDAARAAAAAIATIDDGFLDAVITPMDAGDVAPVMPMTERETIEGARARATSILRRAARDTSATMCLAIGVEGGLDPIPGDGARYTLSSWAAA